MTADPLDLARRLREATYGTERHAIGELVKEIERLRAIEKAAREFCKRIDEEWFANPVPNTAALRAALREKGAEK